MSTPSIAVVAHLYYQDLLEEFHYYLDNLSHLPRVRELITVNDPSLVKNITTRRPQAMVRCLENSGSDIGPFLTVLEEACQSDLILKIHTKKGLHYCGNKPERSAIIRHSMIRPLCGTRYDVDQCLGILEAPEVGMIGSNWCSGAAGNKTQLDDLRDRIGIAKSVRGFVAGTIFWIKSSILMPLIPHADYIISKLPGHYVRDGSYAHATERLLGNLVTQQGYLVRVIH